jgi:hypothetical protein
MSGALIEIAASQAALLVALCLCPSIAYAQTSNGFAQHAIDRIEKKQCKIGGVMSTDELESEALKLAPQDRARLAQKLLHSLEDLSDKENAELWAEEALRRDQAWDESPAIGRPAADVLRDARARLK